MKFTKRLNGALGSLLLISFCMGCVNPKTCLCNEDTHWMLSDSAVYRRLGHNLSDIFFNPDIVKCYHITYKDSIKNEELQILKGYIRDSLLTGLSNGQTVILQFILPSNERNYFNDTIKVQSPYIPCLEFEFAKKNSKPVSILVSTSDHSWQIVQDGEVHFSHNYVETRSVERFCNYFINKYYNKKEDAK